MTIGAAIGMLARTTLGQSKRSAAESAVLAATEQYCLAKQAWIDGGWTQEQRHAMYEAEDAMVAATKKLEEERKGEVCQQR